MSRLRVESFTVSADGFSAGPDQSLERPMGRGGEKLHEWAMATRTFQQRVFGKPDAGETGMDDEFAKRGFDNIGAWILGRNMFSPSRGPWPDDNWQGWWGDEPPYRMPVFVLCHHARAPLVMKGGTVFHFVTEGPEAALAQAREAAKGRDVRVGGGADTVRQYLRLGLLDSLHIAISPVLLGSGTPLFQGLDLPALGYRLTQRQGTARALHLVIER